MKPEIARRWADALESGKFKQATGALCRVDKKTGERSYCCLGVLCEMAIEDGVRVSVKVDIPEYGNGHVIFDSGASYLPKSVQEWAGVETPNPRIGNMPASYLNDGGSYKFGDIARMIRADIPAKAAA